jgi:hypothetical protein
MRPLFRAITLICLSALAAWPQGITTVFLKFDKPPSEASVVEMKREAQALLSKSVLDWRMLDGVTSQDSFERVAIVRFKGSCEMTRLDVPSPGESGALGLTYGDNGRMLPFSDVECDKLRRTLRAGNMRLEAPERERIFGRALGRVVAHELHHILEQSRSHSKKGFTRASVSPRQLSSDAF